ncbi:WD40-repeat-containing domain protein [Thelephora terrestris]|uniref:WD40-repeat-containing domain protein n=1 Tax=Thelephora terrestris TaxID=56493 RepID=A0A9P6HNF9_9AGAM|nr:WD40-repeat-containing domain protein [Thelephora terrestris]
MSSSPYTVLTTLYGHINSINVVKSSPDGKHLASGGEDGTIVIYSTKTWRAVKRYGNLSPVSALVWHPTIPSTIIFGCKNGDVETVHFRDPEGDDADYRRVWVDWMKHPVTCIAMDVNGASVAISHGAEVTIFDQPTISMWSGMKALPPPPSVADSEDTTPTARSIHFLQDSSLLVSYLEHGIVCWDLKSGSTRWNIVPRVRYIGRSCVSPDGKFVAVSNMYDGVDFYSISTPAFSHTIQYRVNPHMNSPIPVEFFPDGRVLLIGGTHGSARMVDTQTYETIQLLPHSGDLIQAVNVHRASGGGWVISVGVSELGTETAIKVWSSNTGGPSEKDTQSTTNATDERIVDIPEQPRRGLFINILSIIFLVASVLLLNNPDWWPHLVQPAIPPPPPRRNHRNMGTTRSFNEAEVIAKVRSTLWADIPITLTETDIVIETSTLWADIPITLTETDIVIETSTLWADIPITLTETDIVTETSTPPVLEADASARRDT